MSRPDDSDYERLRREISWRKAHGYTLVNGDYVPQWVKEEFPDTEKMEEGIRELHGVEIEPLQDLVEQTEEAQAFEEELLERLEERESSEDLSVSEDDDYNLDEDDSCDVDTESDYDIDTDDSCDSDADADEDADYDYDIDCDWD